MDITDIKTKEAELKSVSDKLKGDFVGLDDQIDKIINYAKIWYIMPDLLKRPIIINLWGMTGTGKTDLVRRFSKYIKMSDKLLEIQMDNEASDGWMSIKSTREALYSSDIEEDEQGIILFDEFQRFRTLEDDGITERKVEKFEDIWMLLSDGVFNANTEGKKSEILETIYLENKNIEESKRREKGRNKKKKRKNAPQVPMGKGSAAIQKMMDDVYTGEDEDDDEPLYHTMKVSYWRAKSVKKMLKLDKSIGELCNITNEELLELYKENLDNQDIYSGGNYKKALVFICGNLDNVYSMSRDVADADSDADILHKFSKQINIVNIKNCLAGMFRPEQVARLGNNHVIYYCLSSESYRKIIDKTLNSFADDLYESHKFHLSISDAVRNSLYTNFVYPSQGVRPVFSGISSFLSEIVPSQMFYSFEKSSKEENRIIQMDKDENGFYSMIDNKHEYRFTYDFDLENVKKKISEDKQFMFAVHESGHAIAYALLFKVAPKMINIELTSFEGAYVIPDIITQTRDYMHKMIQVYYGGLVAEEIVFGKGNRCIGSESDILKATTYAGAMVRKFNMNKYHGKVGEVVDSNEMHMGNVEDTDPLIEEILMEDKEKIKELITNNMGLLIKFVDEISEKKKMNSYQIYEFFKDDIEGLKYSDPFDLEADDEVIYPYKEKYEEFKKGLDKKNK